MASEPFPFTMPAAPGYDPEPEIMALSDQTSRLIAVTRAMVESDRRVDLDGIQQQVGLLCAKVLDLPPGRTGLAKAELHRIAADLDTLQHAMRGDSA